LNIILNAIVAILAFLALTSGAGKIMLVQREVEFFGAYGFTDPILMAFGLAQLVGVVLLIIPKTRVYGAAIVGITFLVSACVLLLDGNILVAIITLIATLLLGIILRQSYKEAKKLPS